MKKILLVLSLLGLFGGWIEKSNEKEKTEISSVDFKEAEIYYNRGSNKYKLNDYEGAMLDFKRLLNLILISLMHMFLEVLSKIP